MYMYSGVKLSMNSVQLIDFSLLFLTTVAVTYCGMAGRYWLNGYDTDNSGTFTWIESETPTNYTNWDKRQPNDHNGNDQKCIESNIDDGGRWNDLSCLSTRWVVCERNS